MESAGVNQLPEWTDADSEALDQEIRERNFRRNPGGHRRPKHMRDQEDQP